MSIDRSNASKPIESVQRIGEVRRVDREATKQYGDKNDRGGHGGHPNGPPVPDEVPHDIVELSPGLPVGAVSVTPPVQHPAAPDTPESERHIDIKV